MVQYIVDFYHEFRRLWRPKILGTEATNLVLKIFVFGSLMIKEIILCFPSSNSSPYIAMVWTPRQIDR
jgi:hypothetical protein